MLLYTTKDLLKLSERFSQCAHVYSDATHTVRQESLSSEQPFAEIRSHPPRDENSLFLRCSNSPENPDRDY